VNFLRSRLMRLSMFCSSTFVGPYKVLERGTLRMDLERHTCTWKNERVTLTVTEFLLLQALASRPGGVKSRKALIDSVYDGPTNVDKRNIDSHIERLSQQIHG